MSDYGSFIDISQFWNKLQFGIVPLDKSLFSLVLGMTWAVF